MKNLIIYSGIALVMLTNIKNESLETKMEVAASSKSSKEIVVATSFNTEFSNSRRLSAFSLPTALRSKALFLKNLPKIDLSKTIGDEEPIEGNTSNKRSKTADEVIFEDNLITNNNLSNETFALDFDIINSITEGFEIIESTNTDKPEKSADQLIAEDNAITGNTISNETHSLDLNLISKNAF